MTISTISSTTNSSRTTTATSVRLLLPLSNRGDRYTSVIIVVLQPLPGNTSSLSIIPQGLPHRHLISIRRGGGGVERSEGLYGRPHRHRDIEHHKGVATRL